MPDTTPAQRAVFLSYAREDTDAARRIADALRSQGIEVWFDQAELRGGEAWDAKIRKQIRECALFLAIVSEHTQARQEGYFRREWRLAVERTQDMAAGVAFVVPVVIDDTAESQAVVPDEFMRVQWTRLPGALPTPQFVAQVKSLLGGGRRRPTLAPMDMGRPTPAVRPSLPLLPVGAGAPKAAVPVVAAPAPVKKSGRPVWIWGVLAVALVAVGVGVMVLRQPEPTVEPPKPVAAKKPVSTASVPAAPVAPVISDKSIAVLPFENMSEDRDNAFFTEGVHEDILTNLSFIRDLRVVSRTSVMQYRGTTKPIRQIAQELGVAYILEGSVRRAGGKVRVTGQLIHAATDEHVWAKAYDRDLTDVFAIQAELAQAIATALQTAISPAEKSLLERKPTANPAAYDLYVKARTAYQGNSTGLDTIEKWLVDAVQLDPGFAPAWAQLGALHVGQRFNEIDASAARLEKAKAAIDTAVRLASDDPVVIEMRGDYFYYGYRDYTRAAEQYRRLLTLRPNSAEAFGSLGLIYRRQGRWKDAEENLRKALELDSRNNRYRTTLATHFFGGRRYAASGVEMSRAVEAAPGELIWKYYGAAIPFFVHGTVQETDAWFSGLKPRPEDGSRVLDLRKQWARLHGDFAGAIRLGQQQPYFEGDGTPHWQQDFNAAFDCVGNGDLPATRVRLKKLVPELRAQLEKQPSNSALWTCVGLASAVLGDREQALAAASKLAELLPESADAVNGPPQSLFRAQILAWVGRKEQALAELARLLRTPYGANVHFVRHDPGWFPLRGDPRFEALLSDPKNNAPLF